MKAKEIIDGTIDAALKNNMDPRFGYKIYINSFIEKELLCPEGEQPNFYRGYQIEFKPMDKLICCFISNNHVSEAETKKLTAMFSDEENKVADLKTYEPYGEEWKKEISKLKKDQIVSIFSAVGKEKDDYKERLESVRKDKAVMFEVIADRQADLENIEKVCLNFLNAISKQELIIYPNEGCKVDHIQLIEDAIKRKK